jgi:hypothetical protein
MTKEYHNQDRNKPHNISKEHARQLLGESGISPEIVRGRGYRSVKRRDELAEFPEWQRRLGLYIPMYSPDGEKTGCQLKPDRQRKGLKYESPLGAEVILDVHPQARDEVRDGDGDLFIVEGVKKADSLLSRGATSVALSGVWMAHVPKSSPKKLLPCWDHVRLQGRKVLIAFDSDWQSNENVQRALEWLAGALDERGADVRVAYLEDGADGSKVGADDYLVRGSTVAGLKALCRKFEVTDVGRIRLSKDQQLRGLIQDLERRLWDTEWKGMGGATSRDVYLKLIEAAKRHGKVHPDGIRITKAQGPLALEVKVSGRTLWRALNRLEEWNLIYRDNEGRKQEKAGAFVMRAKVSHKGKKLGADEGEVDGAEGRAASGAERTFDAGDLPLRAPRQRWSSPPRKRQKRAELVPGTRRVRIIRTEDEEDYKERLKGVKRLGKIRGSIIDVLETQGGSATLREIADILHRSRPRDIRRRILPDLEACGIIAVEGEMISLTPDWLEALERQNDGAADERAQRSYERRKDAYRAHRRGVSEASRETIRRTHKLRDKRVAEQRERIAKLIAEHERRPKPRDGVIEALERWLTRHPSNIHEKPSWMANTLWAYDYTPFKPTPEEIEFALFELRRREKVSA